MFTFISFLAFLYLQPCLSFISVTGFPFSLPNRILLSNLESKFQSFRNKLKYNME